MGVFGEDLRPATRVINGENNLNQKQCGTLKACFGAPNHIMLEGRQKCGSIQDIYPLCWRQAGA